MADAQNTAAGAGSSAGDDDIEVGNSSEGASGDDLPQLAGDALATGDDGDAYATNFAAEVDGNGTGNHSAGNDTITAGNGGWPIEIGRASGRERVCQYV